MVQCKDSALEKWLIRKKMSTNQLVELVGCSRPIIWKIKRGIPVCPLYAKRVYEITQGEVTPLMKEVGRESY